MKLNLLIFITILSFSACKKDLNTVTFNDNPYDAAYTGPKVVQITAVSHQTTTFSSTNSVGISCETQQYTYVMLYRNGTLWATISRTSYTNVQSGFHEIIYDRNVTSGVTYKYTAALKYDDGVTQQSDPVFYTTP